MKKLLMTLVIACFSVVFAHAQDAAAAPKKPTSFPWTKVALTEIGCDNDQIKKIAVIKKDAAEKRKTIDENATLDEKGKKAAVKVLLKERLDAMNAVLTEDQRKKVDEINVKLKEEAKAAKGN